MKNFISLLSLVLVFSNSAYTQCSQALWTNPSFEGPLPAQPHVLPPDWNNCNGTTSDTQPGNWGVNLPPTDGSTYIGLVSAQGWQETASQYITPCLTAGVTYTFTIDMTTFDETSTPGVCDGYLYLWAGNLTIGGSACDFSELVWQSALLPGSQNSWSTQTISFTPTQNWCSLTFQAIDDGCATGSFYVLVDNLSPINPLSLAPSQTNTTCAGNDGSATVTPSGGTGTYTYAWTPNVSSTNTASNLSAGNYSVTVTDGAGCSATQAFTITGPTPIDPVINNPSTTICPGQTVTMTVSSTGGSGTVTYVWTPPGISGNTLTVSPSTTTSYQVVATDGTGCTDTTSTTITVVTSLVSDAGPDVILSCTNPTSTLDGTGSTSGSTYSWSGPGIVSGGTTTTPTVNQPGMYILTVSAGSCSEVDTVIVTQNINAPVADAGTGDTLTCATTSLNLDATGSTGSNLSYSWSGPGIVSGGNTATPTINVSGTYTVTVTNTVSGCVSTDVVVIVNNTIPPLTNAGSGANLDCNNPQATLTGSPTGSGYTYNWTTANGNIVSGGTNSSAIVNAAGTYYLTVTGTNGCTATDSVVVTSSPNPVASFTLTPTSGSYPLTVTTDNLSTGTGLIYSWNFGDGNTSSAFEPGNIYPDPGTYPVTLLVTDVNGCMDSMSVIVNVFEPYYLFIPNVFSPNGDGANDVFEVLSTGVTDFDVEIYNRWGQLMYGYTDVSGYWDGKKEGKEAPDGTYYYVIHLTIQVTGEAKVFTGTVTLIR